MVPQDEIIDRAAYEQQKFEPSAPSATAEPTTVTDASQQGCLQRCETKRVYDQ